MLTKLYDTIFCMENFDLKRYAHIGDAVYELFIRENVVFKTKSQNSMHKMTISYVCADFQAKMAQIIFETTLNDDEKEIFRRARNLPLTVNKKNKPDIHRYATAFETIIGYFYINDNKKLEIIFKIIKENLNI